MLRRKAEEENEARNVENLLRGIKNEALVFVPPSPPVEHIFIGIFPVREIVGRKVMLNLINKALVNRLEWDNILLREQPLALQKVDQSSRVRDSQYSKRSRRPSVRSGSRRPSIFVPPGGDSVC